ncbi:MAG: transglutaminase domain-containing protein [Lachnospiraceae bacterium]|nr:transglutaminase domain-containing protein [Lachnospiraceae bacterium]
MFYGKMKKTENDENESRYLAAETAFIALITYMASGLIFHELFEIETEAVTFVVWSTMAGLVFGIQKIGNTKVINMAIWLYGILLLTWLLFRQSEQKWQYAVLFCGGFLALQVLYYFLQKTVGKLLCGLCVMGLLIGSRFWEIEYSRVVIAMGIFLFLYVLSEAIAYFYHGNNRFLVIIYALTAILTMITPAPKEPYDWGFVYKLAELAKKAAKSIVTEIQYQLSDVTMDGVLSFQVTGYSDGEMNLFQEMITQDVEQLVLQGNYTKGNLYLKGRVCNKYTGSGWITGDAGQTIDYRTDALMTLYAIFRETEDINELNRFMEVKEQEVILKNIKTRSLFYPLKILSVSEKDTKAVGDQIQANQVNKRGYEYTYYFLDVDYANERLIQIMNHSEVAEYEETAYDCIYTNLEKLYHIEMEKMPFETFCEQAKLVEEEAGSTNDTPNEFVSERVKTLSKELTAECKTDYEVCKQLESYLCRYHYNQSAVIPQDVNVLDYFLFDGKEGYCAHYATALAAMLLSEGIPARVAEGFLVNYKERTDIYMYSVSSRLAHVWVEAYLDGFGWIRLEPTAIYRDAAGKPWYIETEELQDEEMTEAIEDEVGEEGVDWHMPEKEEDMEGQLISEQKNQSRPKSWMMMLKLLLGMLLCIGFVAVVVFFYQRGKLRKSNHPDVVCMRVLAYLEKNYTPKLKAETVREYFRRICKEMEQDNPEQESLMKMAETIDGYWYGNQSISSEMILWMKEYITS